VPGSELKADLWVCEYITPWDVYHHGITKLLAAAETDYQHMQVVETGAYGKALVLDGKWQCCTGDEFLYHEPIIHPACVMHGGPRRVLVLGGGDGCAMREALRWKSVEQVTLVDIDGQVVDACKQHLPEMHQGAFDDPRTEVVIGDALKFLEDTGPDWDVVVYDLSDPIEEGPSFELFTRETFALAKSALGDRGILVLQAGPQSPSEMHIHVRLINTLQTEFANVISYGSAVPTYATSWGFALASDRDLPTTPDPGEVDTLLDAQIDGGADALKMFDGRTLLGLLQTPKHIRDAIEAETEVYTRGAPPKFFGSGVARAGVASAT